MYSSDTIDELYKLKEELYEEEILGGEINEGGMKGEDKKGASVSGEDIEGEEMSASLLDTNYHFIHSLTYNIWILLFGTQPAIIAVASSTERLTSISSLSECNKAEHNIPLLRLWKPNISVGYPE